MKKILTILFLLLASYSFHTQAQTTTYQLSLKDSTINTLYVGMENRIYIKGLPGGCDVIFEGKTLQPNLLPGSDKRAYTLYVHDRSDLTLHVKKAGREIYSKTFTAKILPDPKPRIGIVEGATATVDQIMAAPYVYIFMADSDYKNGFKIIGYTVTVIRGNDISQFSQNPRHRSDKKEIAFKDDVQKEIQRMKNGDKLMIENIKAIGPDLMTRSMGGFTVSIIQDRRN